MSKTDTKVGKVFHYITNRNKTNQNIQVAKMNSDILKIPSKREI